MDDATYRVKVYMTDAKEIERVFGSKDENFLNTSLEKYAGVFQAMDEAFGLEEPLSMEQVYKDFVMGEMNCPELSEAFGYIYELFVYEFGKIFNFNDDVDGLALEFLDQVDGEVSAFIDIPLPEGEFPHFLSIPRERLEAKKEEFLSNLPEDHSEKDKRLLKEQFEFVFDETKKAGLDLVFFNY